MPTCYCSTCDAARTFGATAPHDATARVGDVFGETRPTLRRNSTGAAVTDWQVFLNAQGRTVAIDGKFGPATNAATKSWQQSKGLTPDGVVGPATWTAADAAGFHSGAATTTTPPLSPAAELANAALAAGAPDPLAHLPSTDAPSTPSTGTPGIDTVLYAPPPPPTPEEGWFDQPLWTDGPTRRVGVAVGLVALAGGVLVVAMRRRGAPLAAAQSQAARYY